jgi:hypothetical protein
MLNSTLLSSAQNVINSKAPVQFQMVAKFINSQSGSSFAFYPLRISQLEIEKDFIGKFADVIKLTMMISPKDYALLQDQGQNLLCVLTITYLDKTGQVTYTPPPIQTQYNVIINDPRDIRKAVPDIQVYTHPSETITVQLVEPLIYNLRHTKINTVYQNITVKNAIYAITQAFGISKIQLVDPENTHQYDHIDLSSYLGIDSIYTYLQSKCGVYPKGSTHYITGGCLYLYPPFETAPSYDKTAIFYQVDTGRFSGNHVFHKLENKNLSIVINSQPQSFDLSVAGSENVGTGFVFTRASRLTDGVTTIDSNNGAQFTDNPALSVNLATNRTAVKDSNNLFHIKSTDNPYPAMSNIVAHQASIMNVQWMNCDPFQLDPGHAVTYYYDYNGAAVKRTGILESARFVLSNMAKPSTKDQFGAVGDLVLRLSPNQTKVY